MNNEEKILEMLADLKSDMSAMKGDISALKSDMSTVQIDISTLKCDMSTVKGDISTVKSDMSEVQSSLARVAIRQETIIEPKLQLLYEGQTLLRETLAPKERVEVLEDDVLTLKSAVKEISNRLTVLEKAQ